jgi:signal transduction histidine kinase
LGSGTFTVDTSRIVTAFSRGAEAITGISAREILGSGLRALPAPLRDLVEEAFAAPGELSERKILLPRTGGQRVSLQIHAIPQSNQKNQVTGVVIWFQDLSAFRKLDSTARRLDRLAQTGVLAASAAHEIKNALVAIRTFIEVLLERNQEAELSNLVSHEIQRIDSILSQLLRFTGPAAAVMSPLHLHEVLENSLKLIHHKLGAHQIKLGRSFKAANDLIKGDEKQLRQAFINLFLNAIDAMRLKGNLKVTTDLDASGVWSDNISSQLVLIIADSGAGIAPEDLPHLYEPFFTTKTDGTGLGLPITRRVIQEHGGTIDVRSELGRGTSFKITLPLLSETSEQAT